MPLVNANLPEATRQIHIVPTVRKLVIPSTGEVVRFIKNITEKMAKVAEERTIAFDNVNRAVNMNMRSPGKTYASFFQNATSQQNSRQPKSSVIDDFMRLANYFLDPEELTLEQEINIFLNKYRNMSTSEAKAEFLRLNKVRAQYRP